MMKKLKGIQPSKRREAEGVDDINTYSVLAAEGFLPGYGLDTGSVVAMAEVPYWQLGSMDFELPRPTALALREYVPGNLIYANGHRFVARRFHRDPDEERYEMPLFEVNTEREAIAETSVGGATGTVGGAVLRTISVCDVDLAHQSQISDEEETRFQMPVAVYGREKNRHSGGFDLAWGERRLTTRRGVHLRLVNVGAGPAIQERQTLGYPICAVCGQSVSPLSSERQIKNFLDGHKERCGRQPEDLGLFADVVADCLGLPSCKDRTEAYSVLEALRMGAAHVLDMHLEDLQLLVIGHVDRDEVDGLLWDPMPGGSGLLEQIRENYTQVVESAIQIADVLPRASIPALIVYRHSGIPFTIATWTGIGRWTACANGEEHSASPTRYHPCSRRPMTTTRMPGLSTMVKQDSNIFYRPPGSCKANSRDRFVSKNPS